jgi:pimeloyl-ACP methyl ester carboxylesterase
MLTALLVTLAVAYLALCVLVFTMQRALIYPAPKSSLKSLPERLGFGHVTCADGARVDVLYLPAPEGAPTVVHFHGNGEQLLNQVGLGETLRAKGLGFLAVEYPGYGATPGSPTEDGIYQAAEAALAMLRAKAVPPEQTVLSGRSLGTGVAVEMARRGHGARVILVSPYTSMVDMGRKTFPFLPAVLLVRDRFDSEDKAAGIPVPVLVLHGEEDTLIPVEMGRRLGQRFPHATVVTAPGAGHDDVQEREGTGLVDRMAAFALGGP